MLDLAAIDLITFDVFGTLLDWRAPLAELGLDPARDFPAFEAACRALQDPARPFVPYTEVLESAAARVAPGATAAQRAAFAVHFGRAPAYPDVPGALSLLRDIVPLGALSNSDPLHQLDVARTLGAPWDLVALAAHVRAYKPHAIAWDALVALAEREVRGLDRARWLHVSAFVGYDLRAARERGLRTCFVHRGGVGDPTPGPEADLHVGDLHELGSLVGAAVDGPVTYEVAAELRDPEVAQRWIAWMTHEHLGRVRAAPVVRAAAVEQIDPTHCRAVYRFARRSDFVRYEQQWAPALRAEGMAAFSSDEVRYTRTVARTLQRR